MLEKQNVLIGTRQKLRECLNVRISLASEMVEMAHEFKYLGMILDNHLNFDKHFDHIVDKSTSKLCILYKTRWLCDMSTAKMLYSALVTPYFDLGNTAYVIAVQYQLNRLQPVQNVAAHLILLADARCPIYNLHKQLGGGAFVWYICGIEGKTWRIGCQVWQ